MKGNPDTTEAQANPEPRPRFFEMPKYPFQYQKVFLIPDEVSTDFVQNAGGLNEALPK